MTKVSTRIILSMTLCCLVVVGVVSSIMAMRLVNQMTEYGNLLLQYEAMDSCGEFNDTFTQAVYKTESIQQFAVSAFKPEEYKKDAKVYMDSYFRPIIDDFVASVVKDSSYIQGAYFSLHPDLAGFPYVCEVYFADYGNGVEKLGAQAYEEYTPDNPDTDWFFGAYSSGMPYWTEPYDDNGVNMVSYVLPVVINGQTIGVAGVDIAIEDMTNLTETIQIYDTGFGLLQDNYGNLFDYKNIVSQFSAENISQMNNAQGSAGLINMAVAGRKYIVGYNKLSNGYCFYTFAPHDEVNKQAAATIVLVIIVIALGLLSAFIISLIVGRAISAPIVTVSIALGRLTDGIYSVSLPDSILNRKDEMGHLARATRKLRLRLGYLTNKVTTIANGDLTEDIELAFDGDAIGIALNDTLINLNGMFAKISHTSHQMAAESERVAKESQSLALGCSQQSAAMDNLKNIMKEIVDNNNKNAEMLKEAIGIEQKIKMDAQTGGKQMKDLTQAVEDISEASQGIHKVLKVIDDIAFQTNILALNAAVEAARAGQYGKGFSVVAEEVRNLAAKSAAAAKETTELVTISTQKAASGVSLAEVTAESFSHIIDGIGKSDEIITQIAQASHKQERSVSLMNKEVDVVLGVVHSTTEASEEYAASAEEMSGQSTLLKDMVEQFKIKDDKTNCELSLLSAAHKKQPAMPLEMALNSGSDLGSIKDFSFI